MKPPLFACMVLMSTAAMQAACGSTRSNDARLREVVFDPGAVISVPVKRGVVTLVSLPSDESITEVGAGLGGDCSKPEAAWCIAAQPGGRHLFVKAKSTAAAANTLAVVTDRRSHALRFVVLADGDAREPVYRLSIVMPSAAPAKSPSALAQRPQPLSPEQLIDGRLRAQPAVVNARYSIAEGKSSEDIVPTLVFDDGRFTYFRFPGNREVPAVFHVLGDDSETLVNTRMEGNLLVVDRVSRRLVLRAGSAVVGVWNEAFDLEGLPPRTGSTADGVERWLKSDRAVVPPMREEQPHE